MLRFNGVKSESEWNREFCKHLTLCNAQVFACSASMMQTPGWPDRYIAHPLFCGWVECKRTGNDLSALQLNVVTSINKCRAGTAFVLWLEHDELYPVNISWYSRYNKNWSYIDSSGIVNTLGMLKQLASIQKHEKELDRKHGNVYA